MSSANPFEAPKTDPDKPGFGTRKPLGSLAQSARGKQLKTARWTLIAVGLLTLVVNAGLAAMSEQLVATQVAQEQQKGLQVDPAARAEAVRTNQITGIGFAMVGVVFIVLGVLVKRYPVPMTVTGLVLYLGALGFTLYNSPESMIQGWLVKVIIIVVLAKAIQAAFAYQKELDEDRGREAFA